MIINNDNITLVIYENKDDNYERILPDFNIIYSIHKVIAVARIH